MKKIYTTEIYSEAFKKFEHIQCRTSSVVLLAIFMFFFFRYAIDTTSTIFAPSAYLLILLSIIPHALLIMVVAAFAKIEKQALTCQALGLSLQISKESKQLAMFFIIVLSIGGVGILAFYSFMKFRGIDIHLITPYPVLIPWIEEADLDGKLRNILFLIIPYSVLVLLIAPFVEEAYFTGLIFPALRNRLGFVLGSTLTAFLFTYHHHSPFSEGQLTTFVVMFMTQGLSFFLYEFTRSLYPSIVFHSLRNMSILFLELSAFI